jgi:aspartyl-tRNA(Asn)/glutamyl-tRNA(Gln) amidotransferase subunit B
MSPAERDVMIGLEVHVQLNTRTKLFCGCPARADRPNTATCPVCLGHPGSKPVLNKAVVRMATRLALALGCAVAPAILFSRKTYFYPDLAKNYQITQYEQPLGSNGGITLDSGKAVRIRRLHIEEDPAGLVHVPGASLADYNRSGIPLVEVVTEPDLDSPEEAREFMKKLMAVMAYLDIFDPDSGVVKADANVSVKRTGFQRVEIKNVTGFKEIERALEYEIRRQQSHEVVRETRGWDAEKGLTYTLRSKESEEDYGYIIDPDLVETELGPAYLAEVRKEVPELGHQRAARWTRQWGIDATDARIIAADLAVATVFERVATRTDPLLAARWFRREVLRAMNECQKPVTAFDEDHLAELLQLLQARRITERTGQQLISQLAMQDFSPAAKVKELGLEAVNDEEALLRACHEAVQEHPQAVTDYKAGQAKSFQFLVGQVMRKTRGRGDPARINVILKGLLE